MNVLTVCNGIGGFRVAADIVGLEVDRCYSSEINKDAIKVCDFNYPQDVPYKLGDITKWREWDIDWGSIDLLIGGTPCQGLSRANSKRENLKDFRSVLFYTYVDILNHIKSVNSEVNFLLENVKPDKETMSIMTEEVGVEPMIINSNLVSAQNRIRCYWFNWDVEQPEDRGITIDDVIYDDNYKIFTDERIERSKIHTKNYLKWDISGKGYYSQQDRAYYKTGKMCTVPKNGAADKLNIVLSEGMYRRSHPVEAERYQTLPDNYTSCITSPNKRIGLCGDGYTTEVIAHILRGMK